MAVQTARPTIPPEVFVTFIVDSGTPSWDDLWNKYLVMITRRIQETMQRPSRFRFSYVLYASADSRRSPIIKDMYFSRVEEGEHALATVHQPLQGPIARTVPGGGSAALEGIIRAIEHFDILESLEPGSAESMKHIIWVTASRPDESKRPLYNNSEKFDDYGWTQCQEWIKKRSINVTLLVTRLPAHSSYTSLYAVVNPSGPEPMPKEGPIRVYLSQVLAVKHAAKPPIPNTAGASTAAIAHTSSPAGVVSSPAAVPTATNASSPNANRKRKTMEDAQTSPRRAKFPPGTIGSTPATVTTANPTIPPPIPPTVPATGASVNITIQRPGSVSSTRAPQPSGARSAIPPPPVGVRPPSASGTQAIPPTAQPTSIQPPSSTAASHASLTTPPASMQAYIAKFLSDTPQARQETLAKLAKMRDEQQNLIRKLASEGKTIEARDRMNQLNRFNDMNRLLDAELRKQQEQRQREQMAGSSQLQNPAARVSIDLSTQASQSGATSTSSSIPNSIGSGISNASMGGLTHIGAGIGSTSIAAQSEQQTNTPSWRGILCVVTGNDKTRMNADILAGLVPIKATTPHQSALNTWPGRIFVHVARSQSPSDQFVQWLRTNLPDGVFSLRLGIDQIPISPQALANNTLLQQAVQKFNSLRNSVTSNKLILKGTVDTPTGKDYVIVFHMPNTVSTQSQIALARFTKEPNLSTLPGLQPPVSRASVSTGPGSLTNASIPRSASIGVNNMNTNNAPNAMGTGVGGISGPLGPVGGSVPASMIQQALNALNNGGGNMVQIQSNPGLATLMSNPQFVAQLRQQQQLKQQQQLGTNLGNPSNLGIQGMGGGSNASNTGAGLGHNPMGQRGSISGSSASSFGTGPGGSSLQQQQFMAALSAHSANLGGMVPSNTTGSSNLGNNMFGTSFPNFGNNNPASTAGGTMGSANFNGIQAQLGVTMGMNNGGMGLMGSGMNIPNNFGMPNNAANTPMRLSQADINDIRRRSLTAAQSGMSQQEALNRLLQEKGWNGNIGGSG